MKGTVSRWPQTSGEHGSEDRRPEASRPDGEFAGTRLKVTLTRSLIGLKPNHVRTLRALGLRRIRATVYHDDTPAVQGMLARVPYAVRVEKERQG